MKETEGGEVALLEEVSVAVKRYDDIKAPIFHPEISKEQNRKAVSRALKELSGLCRGYDLVVLDEFVYLIKEDILSVQEAIEFLSCIPEGRDIVLTGRGAPEKLIEVATYVTLMENLKHPYSTGLRARPGIEY